MFDRFASWASSKVASPWFFAVCVLLVVVWLPSYFLFGNVDTWQLVINTATTIVTFLLVALLQNTQERDACAEQAKLDAIACGVAVLLDAIGYDRPTGPTILRARQAATELRAIAGAETRD